MEKDPRIIKTKKAIEDAFVSLVELKGYSNVKLVDIAKKAQVNRNTIYLHYNSKEEIISSIVTTSMSKEMEGLNIDGILKMRFNRYKLEAFFRAVLEMVDKQAELYRILLLEDQLIGYFTIAIKKIKKIIFSKVKNTNKNDMILTYMIYGAFSIINDYTIYAKGTVTENAKLLADLSMSSMRKLQF